MIVFRCLEILINKLVKDFEQRKKKESKSLTNQDRTSIPPSKSP